MVVSIGITNPRIVALDTLLREANFEIPFYQREYSWDKDKWVDLFDDIDRLMKKDRGHFFGFMTLRRGGQADYEIVEGQQRISTVTILLCVIRDLFSELAFNEPKNRINDTYIYTGSMFKKNIPKKHKITLSRINKDFFKTYIQTTGTMKEKEQLYKKEVHVDPSNKLIFDCYKFFHQKLSKMVEGQPSHEKEEILNSFAGVSVENFFVATTEVSDHLVAYNMFQTINDRGLDLALSDLVKLHLCTKVTEGAKFIEDYWDVVRSQLVSSNMNSFLRHYWLSVYEVVKETRLLEEIQDRIKDEKAAFEFIGKLGDEVDVYEALVKPSNDFWDKRDKDIADLLRDQQIISATIPLPLFMAACLLDVKEFKAVIKLTSTFMFRYLTIGEQESKVLEKIFSDLAVDIRKKKITKVSQIREVLIKQDISDDVYRSHLESKDIKLNKVAKYILEKIESHLNPDAEVFSKDMTLEHILPRIPDAEGEEYMKKNDMDHSALVNKLGNQTLLLGKKNKEIQNVLYSKKSKAYKESSKLIINKDLNDLKSWTEKDIMKRQKVLAKYCMEIWKL